MSATNCATCDHKFTLQDGDIPHADGGFMVVNRGGGQCKACYLESGHWECSCGTVTEPSLMVTHHKFCHQCGHPQNWAEKPDLEVEMQGILMAIDGLIELVQFDDVSPGLVVLRSEDMLPLCEAFQAYRRARGDE